jgi:hypothetical protein
MVRPEVLSDSFLWRQHGRCLHILRFRIMQTSDGEMPNFRAMIVGVSSEARIARTSALVNLACPCFSPCCRAARPLATMSAELRALEPGNKCDGLQHRLLSQVWQTRRHRGSCPVSSQ